MELSRAVNTIVSIVRSRSNIILNLTLIPLIPIFTQMESYNIPININTSI